MIPMTLSYYFKLKYYKSQSILKRFIKINVNNKYFNANIKVITLVKVLHKDNVYLIFLLQLYAKMVLNIH